MSNRLSKPMTGKLLSPYQERKKMQQQQPPINGQPPQTVNMLIQWVPGQNGVQVQGPLGEKLVCYGMLEMARAAIDQFKPPAQPIEISRPEEVGITLRCEEDAPKLPTEG